MNVGVAPRKSSRRFRPFRRVGKVAKSWSRAIRFSLALRRKPADRGYMICTTWRSGSSYLCHLLASTRKLGSPAEYFNIASRRKHIASSYPADGEQVLRVIRTVGATVNGIYGVKVLGHQLARMSHQVDPLRDLPNLSLIRLRRGDLLGQAISFARARQTKEYTSFNRQRVAPVYDADLIRHCLRSLRQQEAIWDAALGKLGARPLTISYEDILKDPQSIVDQIAELVEVASPVAIDWGRVAIRMQRDSRSAEWRARFLAETGDEFRDLAAVTPPWPSSRDSASAS